MTKKNRDTSDGEDQPFGGILGGLADLVHKLGELAEKGQELKRSGEFSNLGGDKDIKAVYGFNVKFGAGKGGDEKIKVEPFGNVARDKESGRTFVKELREPLVDVFEEDDHTLVVAEMPGISKGDIKLEIKDDVLSISAVRGDKKYSKELLLPKAYDKSKMSYSCNNGMVEIKLTN